MDSARWASPDAPVDVSRAAVRPAVVCQPVACQVAVCQVAVATDDEEEAPVGDPEYGDLLDTDWLERVADARERDDDLIDVGLTLDLDDCDDGDELAQVMDLDVGILLTSLLPVSREDGGSSELNAPDSGSPDSGSPDSGSPDGGSPDGGSPDGTEPELGEGSLSIGALRDLLLPEERARQRAEDDDEVGDNERFPAFESSPALLPTELPTEPGAEDDSDGEA
ncbi:MAG: hypothetical protein ABI895_41650 [Deltaproteobacteria bacterium]